MPRLVLPLPVLAAADQGDADEAPNRQCLPVSGKHCLRLVQLAIVRVEDLAALVVQAFALKAIHDAHAGDPLPHAYRYISSTPGQYLRRA